MKQRVFNIAAYCITLAIIMIIGAYLYNGVCPAYPG